MILPVRERDVQRSKRTGRSSVNGVPAGVAASGWACGCSGQCYNGSGVGATGGGDTIAASISDCESQLRGSCGLSGLKTYVGDRCIET